MHAAQRHDAILRRLRRAGSVRAADLAQQLGVSQITIRRDIVELARRGLLVRVHGGAILRKAATAEGRPAPATDPGRGKSRTIGMLVPSTNFYFHELVLGAQAAAEAHHLRLVLAVSGQELERPDRWDPKRDQAEAERLVSQGAHGLLLTTTAGAPDPNWAAALNVPFVLVERRQPLDIDPVEYVASDHEYGAILALRHLARLGHRRIAIYTEETPTSPWIHSGFAAAATVFGLDPAVPRTTAPRGTAKLDHFLPAALKAGATAIVVHPDDKAVMVLQWLNDRGLNVPEDVSLLSYDDEIAAFADVPITAVAPPRRAIGHTAVQMLLNRLASSTPPVLRHLHLLPTLHVRASTQPPRDRF